MARPKEGLGVPLDGRIASRIVPCSFPLSDSSTHVGPEESVPGLECSYGTLAYSYAEPLHEAPALRQQARHHGCHNPIEIPSDRYRCETCGADYCSVHARPEAHDCAFVIRGR